MNQRLLVCCLNIQEARRAEIMSKITLSCSKHLVKSFVDPHFNRSNLTLCGESKELIKAIDRVSDIALTDIDINSSDRLADSTMHHHIGILDNIPIHPLHNTTLQDAGETAIRISECLNSKNIPTLLYGAADSKQGMSLLEVRKATSFFHQGQVKNRKYQIGHPTLGTSAVGAVPYVLSFNIVIDTPDIDKVLPLLPKVRNRRYGVQAMVYRNANKGRVVAEIACNLNQPSVHEGSSPFILKLVQDLCIENGLHCIDSYSTNPPYDSVLDEYLNP